MQRAVRRAILPVLACGAALAFAAPSAQAGFNIPKCEGTSITGQGASFQAPIQAAWTTNDQPGGFGGTNAGLAYCLPGSVFNDQNRTIAYTSSGSGAGRRAFDSDGVAPYRTGDRYIATDDPWNPTEIANTNEGDPAINTDDGVLRQIPVGLGSLTISVHFPDGCRWRTSYDYKVNNTDFTTRFQLPNSKWEQVFDGSIETWGELLEVSPGVPGISAIPGNSFGQTNATCVATPITRAVREDSSGTTFAFKQWLEILDPAQSPDWDQNDPGGLSNTAWPTGGSAIERGPGNEGVAADVDAINGAIGYVELSTARSQGFTMTPAGSLVAADREFWVPLRNGGGTLLDPQTQADGYKSTSPARGAACNQAVITGIPGGADPTVTGDWRTLQSVNSTAGYGICVVTYMGVWDDYRDVYGLGGGTEQPKARTAKDYVTYVTSGTGQSLLPRNDYAKLPPSLLSIAQGGAAQVNWAK